MHSMPYKNRQNYPYKENLTNKKKKKKKAVYSFSFTSFRRKSIKHPTIIEVCRIRSLTITRVAILFQQYLEILSHVLLRNILLWRIRRQVAFINITQTIIVHWFQTNTKNSR